MTSKELMLRTLEFRNTDGRVPRDLWTLRWATDRYPEMMRKLGEGFPVDIVGPRVEYAEKTIEQGDPYEYGEYVDPWGCRFMNIQPGVIGEVKNPQVQDDEWLDADKVHFPRRSMRHARRSGISSSSAPTLRVPLSSCSSSAARSTCTWT